MKDEHFHPNPQIRRLRDTMRSSDGQAAEQQDGAAGEKPGKMEIHHPDGAENPTPGQFHTVTHGAKGKQSQSHADVDAVDEHMRKHFGEEQHEAKAEDGGECPECGAPMAGGHCEQCGYDGSENSEGSEQ